MEPKNSIHRPSDSSLRLLLSLVVEIDDVGMVVVVVVVFAVGRVDDCPVAVVVAVLTLVVVVVVVPVWKLWDLHDDGRADGDVDHAPRVPLAEHLDVAHTSPLVESVDEDVSDETWFWEAAPQKHICEKEKKT
jgi:hypothetical protein